MKPRKAYSIELSGEEISILSSLAEKLSFSEEDKALRSILDQIAIAPCKQVALLYAPIRLHKATGRYFVDPYTIRDNPKDLDLALQEQVDILGPLWARQNPVAEECSPIEVSFFPPKNRIGGE